MSNINSNGLPSPTAEQQKEMLDLHEDGYSVRQIAKRIGFSHATVSRYLSRMGADTDRSKTAEATAARVRKIQEEKLKLAEKLMKDAESMRERNWEPYSQYISTAEGLELVHMDEPPLQDQGYGVKSVDTMVATVERLTSGIDTGDENAAKSALDNIMEGLTELVSKYSDEGVGELDKDHDYDIATDPDQLPDDAE